ncbi:hypothetical protein MUN84_10660 [Hymenobacter sp. 5516J-16]|uniref:Uncharacterized protein n=1 Tax=Hymenobacter sublimis TaxID=2933777 RepID=A0ABY4JAB2_9BACT|nr:MULTISPECIES: hypothetical protein [Hymenobacter]UOQ78936.1 hypothetical protein MUN84_10660 [Hymenobacter sp. 5516J-16]UPL48897.1 hypothetical protein MWH26_17125 [Hymenobacter sublimis]
MRPALKRLQLIERHLLGHHCAAEAAEWQVQLLTDPELATDTEAQRLLYQGLQLAGRQQLRRELNLIHAQLAGTARRHRWLQAAVHGLRRVLPRTLRR